MSLASTPKEVELTKKMHQLIAMLKNAKAENRALKVAAAAAAAAECAAPACGDGAAGATTDPGSSGTAKMTTNAMADENRVLREKAKTIMAHCHTLKTRV